MRLILIALAALAFAGPAVAGTTYTDTTGENAAEADISSVVVTNDPTSQTVTFVVNVSNMPTLETNAAVLVYIDADRNAATGDPGGFEDIFGVTSDGYAWATWNGTAFAAQTAPGFSVAYLNGVMSVTMPAAALGGSPAFDFFAATLRGPDTANPVIDSAPDDGQPLWTYTLATAPVVAPVTTTPATKPVAATITSTVATYSVAAPKSGAAFRVTGLSVDLSNGVEAKAKRVTCTATLAGKPLNGTGAGGCTFKLPKTARHQKLTLHVTGVYGTTPLGKTYSFTVR